MALDEILYAVSLGKPVVAVRVTDSTSSQIAGLKIPIIAKRRDTLEAWIRVNVL